MSAEGVTPYNVSLHWGVAIACGAHLLTPMGGLPAIQGRSVGKMLPLYAWNALEARYGDNVRAWLRDRVEYYIDAYECDINRMVRDVTVGLFLEGPDGEIPGWVWDAAYIVWDECQSENWEYFNHAIRV